MIGRMIISIFALLLSFISFRDPPLQAQQTSRVGIEITGIHFPEPTGPSVPDSSIENNPGYYLQPSAQIQSRLPQLNEVDRTAYVTGFGLLISSMSLLLMKRLKEVP
ncbi:hypothetical protein ACNAN0_01185 [Agrilactobacillus fermenti]|uniref:hypothetical protein n=1 Tax=Agrilactobacillus fermenti TaxID=2586909 RepID=UPI001E5AB00D|nr:hypothetical protein [Agrilactobacillus fermenti]MCD2256531.1 hypothetical protein [Agrilactobacillus fermenti]